MTLFKENGTSRTWGKTLCRKGHLLFQVHVNRFWPAVQLVSLSLSQMFYRLQGYSFLEYTYVIFLSPFFPTTFNHPMAAGFNENFERQQIIPN